MSDYWTWFDDLSKAEAEKPIGRIMTAAGYSVYHTGGGCLAWMKTARDGTYVLVTDQDGGLPELIDEPTFVGVYDKADEWNEGASSDPSCLLSALIYVEHRLLPHGIEPAPLGCLFPITLAEITKYAAMSDIDTVAARVQERLGITDGGLCAMHLDPFKWSKDEDRIHMLREWLKAEGML